MKKSILATTIIGIATALVILSFADEKKASLSITESQYKTIQGMLNDDYKTLDSIKISLHFVGQDKNFSDGIDRVKKNLADISGFVGQVDSVFYPKNVKPQK